MTRWRRTDLLSALAALLGLAAPSEARRIAAAQAPATWVMYAQHATQAITDRLNADAAPAPRLKAALREASADPSTPLIVKVWVERRGRINRIEAPPLAANADRDLRAVLIGQQLGPPPRRMRLPMRLALGLEAAPSNTDVAPSGANPTI